MAWNVSGKILEACSCNMACPCALGPAKPDQGWCAGALAFDIREGSSSGVNLDRRKVVFAVDLPGDFFGGNGTGRIYVDEGATPSQRRELEGIFTGKRGGSMGAVSGLITKWLPTQFTKIDVKGGDKPSFTVGTLGKVTLDPIKTEDGKKARLQNAPIFGAFGVKSEELARSDGSSWSDPQLRRWKAGGAGGTMRFSMSG